MARKYGRVSARPDKTETAASIKGLYYAILCPADIMLDFAGLTMADGHAYATYIVLVEDGFPVLNRDILYD